MTAPLASTNVRDPETKQRRRALLEGVGVAVLVTAIVTLQSAFLPDRYVATAVGFVFLGATWALVWRGDDARVEGAGLALGGLVLPGKIDLGRLARAAGQALGWALVFGVITFGPFFLGWRHFWHPKGTFSFHMPPLEVANEVFGQLVIIALPEEAFYRGYLQSRLDDALPGWFSKRDADGVLRPWRLPLFGATIGPALIVTSLIFALGHFATIREPARLAVFFPSLAFGWLRLRTKGVGAGIVFHAMCNVFSELLGKGFRVY
jgi:membrane protease YdiL (CAAX protease family)